LADALFFLALSGFILLANGEAGDSSESDDRINAADSSEQSEEGGVAPLLSLPLHSWHCAWMVHPQPHPLQQQQWREVRLWSPLSVRGAQPHPLQQQQRWEVRLWARPQPHPLPGNYDSDGVTDDYDDVR
jgi:hypothetical protein